MTHDYADRNRKLRELGFNSYQDYLLSELWTSIKEKAFKAHGRNCRLCPSEATQLHHIGYGTAVLTGEKLSPLVPVCSTCHYKIEFDTCLGKRSLSAAHGAYMRLLKLRRQELGLSKKPKNRFKNRFRQRARMRVLEFEG